MQKLLDINSDMGESYGRFILGDDESVMPYLTSANLACGFHGGDPLTMKRTVALAKRYGVAIGAHFGLPDLMGFGRRVMAVTKEECYAYTLYQVGALKGFLEADGLKLHHIKPHGALFNMLKDEALAEAVVTACYDLNPELMVYWPAPVDRHAFTQVASAKGFRVIGEVYVDMPYNTEGFLKPVPSPSGDPEDAKKRILYFLKNGKVIDLGGGEHSFQAESLCIHGDSPHAPVLLSAIISVIKDSGVMIAAPK